MKMTISNIEERLCSGCGACSNVCTHHAIEMKHNSEGFLFPQINANKCTSCGLCYAKCPVVKPLYTNTTEPTCYAVWASKEIRRNSSSGGMFTLLANSFWKENGAVAGAVFDEDFRSVHHIVTKDARDLPRLQTSKYLQSEIRNVYHEIAELLKANIPVLFVGTPCQVAGLKQVVGENEKLLLVDIACKSVPSTKAYNIYLDELANGRKIKSVAFRDKLLWGWSASMKVLFDDSTQYYQAEWKGEPFYQGFLNGIIDRKSCSSCPFANISRQGDLTLADFWGIHKKDQSWDDRYGTSLVLVNTPKGKYFFDKIKKNFYRAEKMDLQFAINNNPALERPFPMHNGREVFFQHLDSLGYKGALKKAMKPHYDAGIMGFWIGTNYGTILTNYALNHVLQAKNLNVCMIDTCSGRPRDTDYPIYHTHRKEFEKKHYKIVAQPDLAKLNECIDTFVIGSDQVWKYELAKNFGHVLFMDFVSDNNRKVSYASSFGDASFNDDGAYYRTAAYYLKRFDAISVREAQAVELCRDKFGVAATHVIDPVFLCDKKHFDTLAADSKRRINEKYLFAYILDPTPAKREILLSMAAALNLKLVVVLDCEPWRIGDNKRRMNLDAHVLDDVFVEDFVALISDAQAIITDSFHGTAFSIIYNKPFVSIANPGRGFARFESLLNLLHLNERLVYPYEAFDKEYREKQLTSSLPPSTFEFINKEVEQSNLWLDDALFKPRVPKAANYNDRIYNQSCHIMRLQKQIDKLKKEILAANKPSGEISTPTNANASNQNNNPISACKKIYQEHGAKYTMKRVREKIKQHFYK